MKTIAQAFKRYRFEQALTQKDLAKRLGVSLRAVTYYESGRRTPPPTVLSKLIRQYRPLSKYADWSVVQPFEKALAAQGLTAMSPKEYLDA